MTARAWPAGQAATAQAFSQISTVTRRQYQFAKAPGRVVTASGREWPGMSPAMAPKGYRSMANISAQMVKELRERTGAGMMDCKGALGETNGEMEAAVDLLRKKGLAKAAKKAGRIAADGLIGISVKATKGVVVEVNSETDFVARNEFFQGLVKMIADVALTAGTDLDTLNKAKIGSIPVADAIQESIAKIGENISPRRATPIDLKQGAAARHRPESVGARLGNT